MTQVELAQRVNCAVVTILKIEADQRRPSRQIAEHLAQHLVIPLPDRERFVRFARSTSEAELTAIPWGTPFHSPSNLPTSPTPLIGRAQDIDAVRKRLLDNETQLLTLVGPPGIGKTSLSLAVAFEVLDEFSDGVFLISLAPITDPDFLSRTIVQTLALQEIGPQTSLEHLKLYLRDKQMLLVLDNFEQIVDAAPQVAELLGCCPFVNILVTSRAPLRIRHERQFPVPPLALPDLQHPSKVENLPDYSAVELFVERAQAVKPDFSLTRENGQAVAAICNRLDGLPLAIELISARVKLLSPAALLERLHGQLLLASDGLRDLEPRHRTLNAAIGWSYDLLNLEEKILFMRLGVFAGGWTMEAAKIVCQSTLRTLDGMASLLDKCLIQSKSALSGEPRFTLLETIHEFARDRLSTSGEEADLRRRHANFFLKLAENPGDRGLDRIDQDYENLRTALTWGLHNDLVIGQKIAIALRGYWIVRGRLSDGQFWAEQYLQATQRDADVTLGVARELHRWASLFAFLRDDLTLMRAHAQTLLALAEQQHDPASRALGLFFLGQDALQEQDFRRAELLLQEALTLCTPEETDNHSAGILLMLGLAATGQEDYEHAYAFNIESLARYRQHGNLWAEALLLANNGMIKEQQGQYAEARTLAVQSLQLSLTLDDKRTLSQTLEQLAGLISLDGNHHTAARLMGAAETLRNSILAS